MISFKIEFYDANGILKTGGVSSVTLTAVPASVFDVTNTNTSGAATLALSMDNQNANTILAGPSAGGAAAPAFRSLVAADIPSLPASIIGSGTLATAQGGTGSNLSATGGAGNYVKQSSTGANLSVGAIADADLPTALANHTLTGGSINNTPIGATTASTLIASAISLLIGGFKAILTHANTADRTYTLPDATTTLVGTNTTQTLTNKTIGVSQLNGQVATSNGGTGIDTSASTGVASVASGTWAILTRLTLALGGTNTDNTAVPAGQYFGNNTAAAANGGFVVPPDQSNFVPNSSFEVWERGTSTPPDNWTLTGASASVAQESTLVKHGAYSAKVTRSGADCHLSTDLYAPGGKTYLRGRIYTFGAWVYATVPSRVRLRANDGTTTTNSSYHSGGSSWEYLACTVTVGNSATSLQIGLAVDTGNTSGYIDAVSVVEGAALNNYAPDTKPFNRFPRQATQWGRVLRQPVGATGITRILNASQSFGVYYTQSTPAQNDVFSFNVFLEAGTYTLNHLGLTGLTLAIVTYKVDEVPQGTLDWYNASSVLDVTKTISIVIPSDGYHIIKGVVATRNVSATNWSWAVTVIDIYPSAD